MRSAFTGVKGRSLTDEGETASSFAAHLRWDSLFRSLFKRLVEER
jgi:hypothetical protein